MRFLKYLSDLIANVTLKLACCFLLLMAVILFVQVILRFVFNSGIVSSDEIAKYSIIWAVMLAGNILIKEDILIKVDFLDHFWSKNFIKWRDTFYQIIILILLFFLLKEGWKQALFGLNAKITSINVSWFWLYLAVPVGTLFMLYQSIYNILKLFVKEE